MPEWYGSGRVRQGHDFKEACQRNVTTEVVFEERSQFDERLNLVSFQGKGIVGRRPSKSKVPEAHVRNCKETGRQGDRGQ